MMNSGLDDHQSIIRRVERNVSIASGMIDACKYFLGLLTGLTLKSEQQDQPR